jgi:hypothetical protein
LIKSKIKNYFEKNDEENFESMDSTFTPIGSTDSRTRRFQEVKELKSKIEEVEELKKSKIEEVEDFKKLKFDEVED